MPKVIADCNVQRAARNVQRATCNVPHVAIQLEATLFVSLKVSWQ